MALNTQSLPEWLTEEAISELKADLLACDNPYTAEEVRNLPLDAPRDMKRYDAYFAKKVLTEYGLI